MSTMKKSGVAAGVMLGGAIAVFMPLVAFAGDFVPIVPLPFPVSGESIQEYLAGLFRMTLSVAAALAVVMVAIGGLEYMSTDAIGGKTKGRERIQGAVLGLILLIASVLILQVINPCILKLDIFNTEREACNRSVSSTGSSGLQAPGGGGSQAPGGTPGGSPGATPGGNQPGTGQPGGGQPGAGQPGGNQPGTTGAGASSAVGATSMLQDIDLSGSGLAIVCFSGACPAEFQGGYTKLPFQEMTGTNAQSACGNQAAQTACVYGSQEWLSGERLEGLQNMRPSATCGIDHQYAFTAPGQPRQCAVSSFQCQLKRLYLMTTGVTGIGDCRQELTASRSLVPLHL